MDIKQTAVDNFLRYVAITSQSDESIETLPSSKGQWELAKLLAEELKDLGLKDIHIDDNCNLTARLEGEYKEAPVIGFCSHLDTVDVALSPDIHL